MLLKWIVCQVPVTQCEAFSQAQQGWRGMADAAGFLGQCGGWAGVDATSKDDAGVKPVDSSACVAVPGGTKEAYVLGLWSTRSAHAAFLENGLHDALVQASAQMDFLASWQTTLSEVLVPLPGRFRDLAEALAAASIETWSATRGGPVLRVAECTVAATRHDAFLAAQEEIWRPAMQSAKGMLGGAFAVDGKQRYWVFSLWESTTDHARYCREDLPTLLQQVHARDAFPNALCAAIFPLQKAWMVAPITQKGRLGEE